MGALASRSNPKLVDQRVSTCVPCGYGIFKYQEYVWTHEGFEHKRCSERLDETQDTS